MFKSRLVLLPLIFGVVLLFYLSTIIRKSTIDEWEWEPNNNKQTCNRSYPENLPNIYLDERKNIDLEFSHNWQIQKTSNGDLYLMNAFLDDREYRPNATFSRDFYTVRIIGMYNNPKPRNIYCQIWYGNSKKVVVKSDFYQTWRDSSGGNFYHPYIISCKTRDFRIPISVSLLENKHNTATNNLKIFYEKVDQKQNFAVCVKGLNYPFEDVSRRLVEWIELMGILGADHIHFHLYHVHPNVQKVLNYYQKQGNIRVTPTSLVGEFSNFPILQKKFLVEETSKRHLQEIAHYNDCFYKFFTKYKYVITVDTDEVILPRTGNWYDLMMNLHSRNGLKSSYLAKNVEFFDQFGFHESNIPNYVHILKHVQRAKQFSDSVKGFHDTEKVVALNAHTSLKCLDFWGCDNVDIDVDLAQMQHYRSCGEDEVICDELEETVFDAGVWRFQGELIGRVRGVLIDLGLLEEKTER